MSDTRTKAIATLVRWREFEESRASSAFQGSCEQARSCAERVVAAEDGIERIRSHRSQLQASPSLDLERIRLVAQIEEAAWERWQDAERESASAEERRLAALARHAQARARTRVGAARLRAARTAGAEREEKQLFDRMADIYQARRTSHD